MIKTRHAFQLLFLVMAVVLTIRNLLGLTPFHLESWCPSGGLETFYFYLKSGMFLCATSGINFILFIAVIVGTLLVGRAFCSWVCPVGTLMEFLSWIGGKGNLALRTFWSGSGRYLGHLRYVFLLLILYFTHTVGDLILRPFCPYYVMFSGQEHEVAWWSKWFMVFLIGASLAMPFFWCKVICPLGAFLGLLRKGSPVAPTIAVQGCTMCRACDNACPQQIKVSEERRVRSADCTQCLECIPSCQARVLELSIGFSAPKETEIKPRRIVPTWVVAILTAIMMSSGLALAYWYPMPTLIHIFPPAVGAEQIKRADLIIDGLRCRGTAETLVMVLEGAKSVDRVEAFAGEHRLRLYYRASGPDLDALANRIEAGVYINDPETGQRKLMKPFKVIEKKPLP